MGAVWTRERGEEEVSEGWGKRADDEEGERATHEGIEVGGGDAGEGGDAGLEAMRRRFGRTEVARVVPDGVDTATARAADARRERRAEAPLEAALRAQRRAGDQQEALTDWINEVLAEDTVLAGRADAGGGEDALEWPIRGSGRLFEALADGVVLARLVDALRPGTMGRIKVSPRNLFERDANLAAVLKGCETLGCVVVNIAPEDLGRGLQPRLLLGLLHQLHAVGEQRRARQADAAAAVVEAEKDAPPTSVAARRAFFEQLGG